MFGKIRKHLNKSTPNHKTLSDLLDKYIKDNYIEELEDTLIGASDFRDREYIQELSPSVFEAEEDVVQEETHFYSAPSESPHMPTASFEMALLSVENAGFQVDTEADIENYMSRKLAERMEHMSDTFSEYLMYLIKEKKFENTKVWRDSAVDKKVFSKIKKNPDYHPMKKTVLCLCIGAELNLDETKDLLARAGYALSPCDKQDVIFQFFIENEIYDITEIDIQLEKHGMPSIVPS